MWQEMYFFYINTYPSKNIHILRFENLKRNLEEELQHLMNFLGVEFNKSLTICVREKQKGSFKRPKPDIDFKKYYTNSQWRIIKKTRTHVYQKLGFL